MVKPQHIMVKPHNEGTAPHNEGTATHKETTTLHNRKTPARNEITSTHNDKTTTHNEGTTSHNDQTSSHNDKSGNHNEEPSKHNANTAPRNGIRKIQHDRTTSHNDETSKRNDWRSRKAVMAFHRCLLKFNFFVSSQKQQHKGSRTPQLNHKFIIRGSLSWNIAQKRMISMINYIQYFNCQNTIKYFKIPEKQFTTFVICCNDLRRVLQLLVISVCGIL